MKTLNLYVTKAFLLTFGMAIFILTFAMTGARIAQALKIIANGIPVWTFLEFVVCLLPMVMTYTVPWAIMAAVMLVFGRLSADSEITAMRACGVSILQIIAPILLFTLALSGFCLYLQLQLGPPMYGQARSILENIAIEQPTALFEPGKPIYYENATVLVSDKAPDGTLLGVQIYYADPKQITADLQAERAAVTIDETKKELTLNLQNCIVSDRSNRNLRASVATVSKVFNYGEKLNRKALFKRPKFMTLKELVARIKLTKTMEQRNPSLECDLEVELNQRIALALSPIAFLLLGLPLAVRTSRRETSVGLFLSVILAGGFFLAIILCDSLTNFPQLYPQYLLWLPNIVYQIAGAVLLYRLSQR